MKNGLNKYKLSISNLKFQNWLILIYLIIAGCNKSNQATPLTPGYSVYMAGNLDGNAVYWKNGSPVILSDSGNVRSAAGLAYY